MNEIKLSYVISTYNKLPYLKEAMKHLLDNVEDDEEVIVADAGSTDGTVEYLAELYKEGKIDQFLSEPDRGEAHGFNKCFLMAQGELIKIITDDDVFYYPAIKECKNFMLKYKEIDVMGGDYAGVSLKNLTQVRRYNWVRQYRKWLDNQRVAYWGGLGLMIRKKSLALTGLFDINFTQVDIEYSMRVSYRNANIAFNTAILATRISNPQSNLRNMGKKIRQEYRRAWFLYGSSKTVVVEALKRNFNSVRQIVERITKYYRWKDCSQKRYRICEEENIATKMLNKNKICDNTRNDDLKSSVENAFDFSLKFMDEYNNSISHTILYKGK